MTRIAKYVWYHDELQSCERGRARLKVKLLMIAAVWHPVKVEARSAAIYKTNHNQTFVRFDKLPRLAWRSISSMRNGMWRSRWKGSVAVLMEMRTPLRGRSSTCSFVTSVLNKWGIGHFIKSRQRWLIRLVWTLRKDIPQSLRFSCDQQIAHASDYLPSPPGTYPSLSTMAVTNMESKFWLNSPPKTLMRNAGLCCAVIVIRSTFLYNFFWTSFKKIGNFRALVTNNAEMFWNLSLTIYCHPPMFDQHPKTTTTTTHTIPPPITVPYSHINLSIRTQLHLPYTHISPRQPLS